MGSQPPVVEQCAANTDSCSLRDFLLYFLHLGTFGFGGPIALVGYMQRDLVETRRWISNADYMEGLALAEMAPGPLAAQLAIYLGWVRGGVSGATLTALVFIAPSLVMVLLLSALYVRFGSLPWMRGAFYGISAAVIGIILRSAFKLVGSIVGKDRLLWGLFVINALVTAWTSSELVWLLLLSGVIALFIKAPPRLGKQQRMLVLTPGMDWLVTGFHGAASKATLWKILLFFSESGAVVFGSGLAVVPFLHGGVVDHFRWLNEQQFLDAVAVAMITPGPVVITVAFIGYLVAGPVGGLLAAVGVFLPVYAFVLVVAPHFRRLASIPQIGAVVSGVTAGATGAIAGAIFILGKRAVVDVPTLIITCATLAVVFSKRRKVPEPFIILIAGLAGILIKSVIPG